MPTIFFDHLRAFAPLDLATFRNNSLPEPFLGHNHPYDFAPGLAFGRRDRLRVSVEWQGKRGFLVVAHLSGLLTRSCLMNSSWARKPFTFIHLLPAHPIYEMASNHPLEAVCLHPGGLVLESLLPPDRPQNSLDKIRPLSYCPMTAGLI